MSSASLALSSTIRTLNCWFIGSCFFTPTCQLNQLFYTRYIIAGSSFPRSAHARYRNACRSVRGDGEGISGRKARSDVPHLAADWLRADLEQLPVIREKQAR